jgi:hypothetical protein
MIAPPLHKVFHVVAKAYILQAFCALGRVLIGAPQQAIGDAMHSISVTLYLQMFVKMMLCE